jgi:UDP-N-acetylmuramoylalanine--D-glutamate ligase
MKDYKTFFEGKKITLMGLGLLGRGVGDACFLAEQGSILTVTDLKSEAELAVSLEELKAFPNITYHLGGHMLEDFMHCDMVIKAAGVPQDSPYVAEAKKYGIPVRMSADLFVELSDVMTVGLTGTRGKSTTTHCLVHILECAGKKVLLGGNVRGVSTLSLLPQATPDTIAVLELDSWQLQGFSDAKISPQVAVFTTFLPDHMAYYKNDMGAYFADKAAIFLNQKGGDTLVVGEQAAPFLDTFGYKDKIKSRIIVAGAHDVPADITLLIPGEHNRANVGIAMAAAQVLGVANKKIIEALATFKGVPGRLELIREVRGIKIYNDTTATTPDATIAALKALDPEHKQNIILIMGGADKGLDMHELLREIPAHCKKTLLLAGSGTDRIKNEFAGTMVYQNIADAVKDAYAVAELGDSVLLSPAFASFGMFKNEYDRGDQFNALVAQLS